MNRVNTQKFQRELFEQADIVSDDDYQKGLISKGKFDFDQSKQQTVTTKKYQLS